MEREALAEEPPREEAAEPGKVQAKPESQQPPGLSFSIFPPGQTVPPPSPRPMIPLRVSPGDGPRSLIQRYVELQESDIGKSFLAAGRVLELIAVTPGRGTFKTPTGTMSIGFSRIFPLPDEDSGSETEDDVDQDVEEEEEEEDEDDEKFDPVAIDEALLKGREDEIAQHVAYLSKSHDLEGLLGEPVQGHNWLALHRRLLVSGQLRNRKRGSKFTQNQVRSSLSLLIRSPGGGLRVVTREIRQTFASGEAGLDVEKLKSWLIEIGVIESRGDYSSARHAHSEEELVLYLRDNVEAYVKSLMEEIKDGDVVEGVVLDLVSYPNTVCGACHSSLDALMSNVLVPTFSKASGTQDLRGIVNASGNQPFAGSGPRDSDRSSWIESAVPYDDLSNDEARSRHNEQREARSRRGRSTAPSSGTAAATSSAGKRRPARDEIVTMLGGAYGTFVRIGGEGLNCYIRSLITGLARRGIIPENQIENLVAAIADHLNAADLRIETEMIDAGGLAAAEVRRTIAQLTEHLVDGGVDIGITVIQWDSAREQVTAFQANQGTYQMVLLYTPGHFDLLD